MSYRHEFETQFVAKLRSNATEADLVRWVTEKVLESYRNGIKAGQKGVVVKRDGKSRRRSPFTESE